MKNIIRLEELAILALCVIALSHHQAAWWWYLLLALGPDISMLGYLGGNKIGAFCYNFFHHKAIAVLVMVAGMALANEWILMVGIVLFGHSSMDRFFGYGLKTSEGFKYTHLGMIGKK